MNNDADLQTPTLPEDLILDGILPRLPVKSLLRFKSVSKAWNSTISSIQFAKSHFKFSSFRPQFLILANKLEESRTDFFGLHYKEADCNVTDFAQLVLELELGSDFPRRYTDLVGIVNGIVCLYVPSSLKPFFVLWNPATRIYRRINIPEGQDDVEENVCQFFYDDSVDDYKIFGAFYGPGERYNSFYVFSLSTFEWKRISKLDNSWCFIGLAKGVMINDTVYFTSHKLTKWYEDDTTAGFDLVADEMREFQLVKWLSDKYELMCFSRLRGCLSLICGVDDYVYDVWMLKQLDDWNSWKKAFSVDGRVTPIISGFSGSGKCLVYDEDQLKVFDPSRGISQLPEGGVDFDDEDYEIVHEDYVESLVPLF